MPPAIAEPEPGERVVKELPALMDGSAGDTNTPDTSTQLEVHKPRHVVGIIYPPPEVRNIVDKTASFVARNGPEFESRIRQNELNNPKFNFLNGGDPYHAYYQHRVEEIREGKAEPVGGTLKPLIPLQLTMHAAPAGSSAPVALAAPGSQVRAGQEMFRPAAEKQMVVTEPPPEYEFIADPPSISAVDLDIVKLTAQFVARNGRQFLTNLMNREQRNYQFDFLRPQHSLFQYFTKLLEQYTKVLIPPKDLMAKLDIEADSPAQVLDRVRYRVEWDRLQEARKRRQEEAVERERVSYAQIEWHDFVVVETVDYQPWEQGQFPPPTTSAQVGQRVLMQERIDDGEEMQMSDEEPEPEPEESSSSSSEEEEEEEEEPAAPAAASRAEPERGVADNTQVQDMEEDSDDEPEEPRKPPPPPSLSRAQPPPPPMPPKHDQVVIKKYDPKAAAKPSRAPAPDEYLISPITGERIPASQVAEHMRIGLLDPRWVEQRDRQLNEKVNQETVFATGGDIGSHLQNLAERRTDIFGAGDEETIIGKKIGEEEKRADDKSIWDGHSSSVESARSAARANITLDQQISHIHKAKGLMEERERIGPKKTGGRDRDRRDRRDHDRDERDQRDQRDRDERDRQPPPPPPLPPTPKAPAPPPPPAPAPPPPPRETPKPPPPAPPAPRLAPPAPRLAPPAPRLTPQLPQPPQPLLLRPPLMAPQMAPQMGPQGVMMAPRPPVILPARPMFMQAMPAGFMPQMQPGPPRPPMQMSVPEPMSVGEEEPPSKRARTEDSLVAEHHWLARHPQGSVTFCVAVPTFTDKPEWRLSGQTLSLTMPLTDMVSVVKARLHDETGLPPGKQKLLGEGIFFKDSNTLAYYNVANGSTIHLQLKERGGRKK